MMNVNFDKLKEKKAEFDKTPKEQLIKWLEEEVSNYKTAKSKSIMRDNLMDIIVLVMQIAERENMSIIENSVTCMTFSAEFSIWITSKSQDFECYQNSLNFEVLKRHHIINRIIHNEAWKRQRWKSKEYPGGR